ncbi:hypothetical protein PFISCL1PPCAC_28928 [Pristionchus fissidentatus]|uniref:PDZ domain-containing protein n=1 Tax=Pristionchus fissidentatus TaxID=1538716 RepID=A0AAV5WZU2_9BILA|nr:hypothetical protein PFISCL1PPCAC_28928 [Pristionchus fissidentatus]
MFPFSRKKEKVVAPTGAGAISAPIIAPVIVPTATPRRPPVPPEKPARATPARSTTPPEYEAPIYDNITAPAPAAVAPALPARPPRAPVSVSAMLSSMNNGSNGAAPPQPPPRQIMQQPAAAMHHVQQAEEEPKIVFRPNRRSTEDQRAGSGSHAFGSLKEFDIAGLSLPALACVQVAERRLLLHRNVAGDFGFSIRRVQYPTASGDLRTVVFAEPTEAKIGPPRPDDVAGLLPGDELVEVQGERVARLSRDELQEVVRQAGDTINLVVRAVPELAEFCSRSGGGGGEQRDAGDSLLLAADVDTSVGAQEVIADDVRVWLLHKGGYTQARLVQRLDDGRARIVVAGREMTVDATDVDKANAAGLDRIGDLAGLKYLNETSAVHVLRHRFGSGLAYTNAGSSSLLHHGGRRGAAPQRAAGRTVQGLSQGTDAGARLRHGAAHLPIGAAVGLLAVGAAAGRLGGRASRRSCCSWRTTCRHAAGWTKALSFDRLSSALGVLQAMGNAATALNSDSSRFLMMLQLGFDKAAALKSAKICASLLESDRVAARPEARATSTSSTTCGREPTSGYGRS